MTSCYKKKFMLIAVNLIFMTLSCGDDGAISETLGGGGQKVESSWSDEDRKNFRSACVVEIHDLAPKEPFSSVESYCRCMQEDIEKRAKPDELSNRSQEIVDSQIKDGTVQSCLNESGIDASSIANTSTSGSAGVDTSGSSSVSNVDQNGVWKDPSGIDKWVFASSQTYTWHEANNICESLILGPESFWRLPTAMEISLANIDGLSNDLKDFAPSFATFVWTSDESFVSEDMATYVSFDLGTSMSGLKSGYNHVLCTNKL